MGKKSVLCGIMKPHIKLSNNSFIAIMQSGPSTCTCTTDFHQTCISSAQKVMHSSHPLSWDIFYHEAVSTCTLVLDSVTTELQLCRERLMESNTIFYSGLAF